MEPKYKTYQTEIKEEGGDTRRMHFLISTDAVDRDNDILDPKGWQLDRYKTNPIVAFAHDYKALPVAKCTDIKQTAKGLEATAEFPQKGVYGFADTVYDMLKGGFLNATSVGFRPIDYEAATDRKGYNFKTQELTEFSIVPIPSKPEALIQQRSGGTDEQTRTWCKAITEWASKIVETKAQKQVSQLLPGLQPWTTNQNTWTLFEKDYDVEAESGELPVARVAKLLALHGFTEEASTLTKGDANATTKAHQSIMDAYANAHHAETVMQDLCGNGQKSLSGAHMAKAQEAHGAISRSKGHAMQAAEHMAGGHGEAVPKHWDSELQQALDREAVEAQQKVVDTEEAKDDMLSFSWLTDEPDPNTISFKDDMLKDTLNQLGPELAALIAGHTRTTLNQMLGRID